MTRYQEKIKGTNKFRRSLEELREYRKKLFNFLLPRYEDEHGRVIKIKTNLN